MRYRVNYVLPPQDALLFNHLESNVLELVIDTGMIDSADDLEGLIADEILRDYGICITKFHPDAVHDWPRVRAKVNSAILERLWCEANERATHFEEMKEKTIEQMNAVISEAQHKADDLKVKWMKSLDDEHANPKAGRTAAV